MCAEKRDIYGISEKEMITIRGLSKAMISTAAVRKLLRRKGRLNARKDKKLKLIISLIAQAVQNVLAIDLPAQHINRRIKVSTTFRFRSPEDLLRIIEGLHGPFCRGDSSEVV